MMVKPGISVLLECRSELIVGRRLGLVSNANALLPDHTHSIDALRRLKETRLMALFAPEHGIDADMVEGAPVASSVDRELGLPVYSLYGEHRRPHRSSLEGLDLLIFDLQEVGARFYTYITTLRYVLEAAADYGLPVIVCDRPNPVGGEIIEGPVLEPDFASFVGPGPLPIRYALTVGELARLYVNEWGIEADLEVMPCAGWQRRLWFDETGLFWAPPSPNLPVLEAALLYPGTCLLEGTNLSEGRGTPFPFQVAGAPWLDGGALCEAMKPMEARGATLEAIQFKPRRGKWAGEMCRGIRIHIEDRARLRPVTMVIRLLTIVKDLYPQQFAFKAAHFDRLAGTDSVRRSVEAGISALNEITGSWEAAQTAFARQRSRVLMYD